MGFKYQIRFLCYAKYKRKSLHKIFYSPPLALEVKFKNPTIRFHILFGLHFKLHICCLIDFQAFYLFFFFICVTFSYWNLKNTNWKMKQIGWFLFSVFPNIEKEKKNMSVSWNLQQAKENINMILHLKRKMCSCRRKIVFHLICLV